MRYQLKITLQDIDPPIWRRVVVPAEFTLFELHHVIQIVMGWQDEHLHDFTIKRRRYSLSGPDDFDDAGDESETRLGDVVAPRAKFVYQYDFGDSWNHVVVVEKALDDDATVSPTPVCVGGARACPPEDSGGPWGYAEKLKALSRPDDEDADELRAWMGEDFDPELFSVDSVNEELREVFQPKASSKKRSKKRR